MQTHSNTMSFRVNSFLVYARLYSTLMKLSTILKLFWIPDFEKSRPTLTVYEKRTHLLLWQKNYAKCRKWDRDELFSWKVAFQGWTSSLRCIQQSLPRNQHDRDRTPLLHRSATVEARDFEVCLQERHGHWRNRSKSILS